MTQLAPYTSAARRLCAGLLFLLPLALPGLFGASTDMLPKRLLLYVCILAFSVLWIRQTLTRTAQRTSPLHLSVSAYILWNLLSLFWSTNPFTGWIEVLQLIALGLLFWYFIQADLVCCLPFLARGVALGGLIVSIVGIAQYLGIGFSAIPSVGLPSSTFIFRNLAAAYLIGALPLVVLAWITSGRWPETLLLQLTAVLMLLFLFYTRTRGAWLAFAGSLIFALVLIILYPNLRAQLGDRLRDAFAQPQLRWGASACILLLIAGGLQPARTSKNVIQQFDEQKATPAAAAASLLSAGSDRGRFKMWEHTGDMIRDNPILGVGLDSWEYAYPLYDPGDKITHDSEPVRPHNDFLWILSELGVIGLGLYLYMLFCAIRTGLQHIRHADTGSLLYALAALMGLSALLIYSLFSFPKEQPVSALFFWMHLAVLGGIAVRVTRRPPNRIMPVLGIALALGACYITIRHISFDRHYQRARAYEYARRWPEAQREMSQALQAGVFDHRARFLYAQYFQKQGRAEAAVTAYEEALEAHPNYAHTHHNLGGAYAALGQTQQAIDAYQKALKIRPGYAQARIHLGNAYVAAGQHDRAISAYEYVLKTNPSSVEAHANLGAVYLQRRQYESAIAALQKAVALQPENAQAHNNLAYAYEQTGRIPEAVAAYERLLKLWRGDAAYRETIARHVQDLRRNLESQR